MDNKFLEESFVEMRVKYFVNLEVINKLNCSPQFNYLN